jgi:hypothetical protein
MTYKINKNYIENIVDSIGLKRFGSIKELCNTIEYLIENEYTTGINLKIVYQLDFIHIHFHYIH